jgi:hypothetical protein
LFEQQIEFFQQCLGSRGQVSTFDILTSPREVLG